MKKNILVLVLFFVVNMAVLALVNIGTGDSLRWGGSIVLGLASILLFFLGRNISNASN